MLLVIGAGAIGLTLNLLFPMRLEPTSAFAEQTDIIRKPYDSDYLLQRVRERIDTDSALT
jgi:hypothetical protein